MTPRVLTLYPGRELLPCYKCGQLVPKDNSVLRMDFFLGDWHGSDGSDCHVLPVPGCIGSPSRYQYIEGQPSDPRPEWVYKKEWEADFRKAYHEMRRSALLG